MFFKGSDSAVVIESNEEGIVNKMLTNSKSIPVEAMPLRTVYSDPNSIANLKGNCILNSGWSSPCMSDTGM